MNTCSTCQEFDAKRETCNCPLNAYPDVYSGDYTYSRTAANSSACGFYSKVIPVRVAK